MPPQFVSTPAGFYVVAPGPKWTSVPSGIFVPFRPIRPQTQPSSADIILRYAKVQLSASDLLGSAEGVSLAARFLSFYSLPATLTLLSRAALVLDQTSYADRMETQRYLAHQFFSPDILRKTDDWIRANRKDGEAYLFSEQQLVMAMSLALLNHRGHAHPLPKDGALEGLGKALLHIANELDPLQKTQQQTIACSIEEQYRYFGEFTLRKGSFLSGDYYPNLISRFHELFCDIAPSMTSHPDFIDIPETFRVAAGMRLDTYLSMGIAVLTYFGQVNRATAHNTSVLIDRDAFFRGSNLRNAAPRFFELISTDRRHFRKNLLRDRQRHRYPHYNFLEAERHPLVVLKNKKLCCLSFKLLQRKFSSAIHYLILDALEEQERQKYLRFVGHIFEKYVQRICDRTFPGGRFVHGFTYGAPENEAGDGWIIYPGAAILLEAKASRFTVDIRLSGDFGSFEKKFKESILKGARQLNRVIDDFKAGAFKVDGQDCHALRSIYPVLVTLEFFYLDHFLTKYVDSLLAFEGLFKQPGVRPLTILNIKDLEKIEGLTLQGENFMELLERRLSLPNQRQWPFSNFLFDNFPKDGPINTTLRKRFETLFRRAAYQLFNASLS